MYRFLPALFGAEGSWLPGEARAWSRALGSIDHTADMIIAASYLSIAVVLFWALRRRDVPFPGAFWRFAVFALCCTALHASAVFVLRPPLDQLAGLIKPLTAVVAGVLAWTMIRLFPEILYLPQLMQLNESMAGEIAERKWLESELREHAANLAYLNVELEVAKATCEAASQSKSEFLANMSHELRTPMTAILGFTDVLLGNLDQEEDLEACRTIRRNGEHLLVLLNDILDLSKIEAGRMQVEELNCSPQEVLDDVIKLMRVRTDAKGLSLGIRYEGPIPERIVTDPTRWRQILVNLVGNAVKFTEVGGISLVVRLNDAAGPLPMLSVDIIDTGIGISDEKIGQLFQPFTQADASTSRRFGGTGLGLTISRRLAELLGGSIEVTSTAHVGSCFTVSISTGSLQGVALVDPHQALAPAIVSQLPLPAVELPVRVLLVEDGPDNQRLISFLLKKAGAEVKLAGNGEQGVELAMASQEGWGNQAENEDAAYDIVLMDMQMPIMDGYQATAELRRLGYAGPIIALTAHAMSHDRQRCLDVGCDDYLTKPIDRQALLEMVARYAAPAITQRQAQVAHSGSDATQP
ncbi:MAG: response regulator [Pirellulales bacterium]|nr:response regulator [Pirellulales bacterium]